MTWVFGSEDKSMNDPVVNALEYIVHHYGCDEAMAEHIAKDVIPLATQNANKAEALDWVASNCPHAVAQGILKRSDCPPILREMLRDK